MRILATMLKEWRLLRRDLGGMLLLLVMPAILVLVMAVVQDAPFRDFKQFKFEVAVADEDASVLSQAILKSLAEDGSFKIATGIKGQPIDAGSLKQLVRDGRYPIGFVLPRGAYAELVNHANGIANDIGKGFGAPSLPYRSTRDSLAVQLYFDPTAKPAFRAAVSLALGKGISQAYTSTLIARINKLSGSEDGSTDALAINPLPVREETAFEEQTEGVALNSVQHNVPAWSVFGIFLLVIPLSASVLREREEGSALRVALVPGSAWPALLGKVAFYALMGVVQFIVMSLIGVYVMPMVGLPSLVMPGHWLTLFAVVVVTGLAATSYGLLVGSVFKTSNQALPFGAISIVVLAALGGIWVPMEMLPKVVRTLANISPLHWSLEGINAVLLRNGGWNLVWPNLVALLLLSAVFLAIAHYRTRRVVM